MAEGPNLETYEGDGSDLTEEQIAYLKEHAPRTEQDAGAQGSAPDLAGQDDPQGEWA